MAATNNNSVPIDIVIDFVDKANSAQKMAKSVSKSVEPLMSMFDTAAKQLEKTPEKFVGKLTYIRTALKSLEPAIESARYELVDFYNDIGLQSKAFWEASEKSERYAKQITALKSLLSDLTQSKSSFRFVGSEEELENIGNTVIDLRDKLQAVEQQYYATSSAIGMNKSTIESLRQSIRKEEADLELVQNALKTARSPKTITQYTQQQNILTESIKQHKQQLASLITENHRLGGVLTSTQNRMRNLTVGLSSAEAEQDRLSQRVEMSAEEIAEYDRRIDEVTARIEKLKTAQANLSLDPSDYVGDTFQEKISADPEEFQRYWQSYVEGAEESSAATNEVHDRLVELLHTMGLLPAEESKIGSEADSTATSARNMGESARTAGKSLDSISHAGRRTHSVIERLRGLFHKFSKDHKGLNINTKKLFKTFMQFGLGARSLYFLIRRLRTEFINAMKSMASQFPEINAQISQFAMTVKSFKGSFITMLQPIVSQVIPVLSNLLSVITQLNFRLAEFFATLTGQRVIYKAVADNVDYADSLDGVASAADKANDKLGEYDNLLVIGQENAGGGGGGAGSSAGDLGYHFEESELGISEFARKLKEAWESANFEEVGRVLAEKFNSIVSSIDTWINETFRPKGEEWAVRIGEIINGFFSGWNADKAGQTIADFFNSLVSIINNFISTTDWGQIAEKFAQMITTGLQSLDINLFSETIQNIADGLVDMVGPIIEALPDVLRALTNALLTLIPDIVAGITSVVDAVAEKMPDLVAAVVAHLPEFVGQLVAALLDLTSTGIESLGVTIDSILGVFGLDTDVTSFTSDIADALSGIAEAVAFYTHDIDADLTTIEDGFSRVFAIASTDWLASETQTGYVQTLVSRLDEIVDAQGNVLAGHEAEAEWIGSELEKLTGIEWTQLGNRIERWGELRQAILDTAAAQQKEAQLAAEKTLYEEAQANLEEYQKAYEDAATKLHDAQVAEHFFTEMHMEGMAELARKKVDEAQATYDRAAADLEHSNSVISQYLADEQAFTAGAYDAMNDSYLTFLQNTGTNSEDLIALTTETAQQYQTQMEIWYTRYQEAIAKNDEDTAAYCADMIKHYAGLLDSTDSTYAEITNTIDTSMEEVENSTEKSMSNVEDTTRDYLRDATKLYIQYEGNVDDIFKNLDTKIANSSGTQKDELLKLKQFIVDNNDTLAKDYTDTSARIEKAMGDTTDAVKAGGKGTEDVMRSYVGAFAKMEHDFGKSSSTMKTNTTTDFTAIQTTTKTLKDKLTTAFGTIKTAIGNTWGGMWNSMRGVMNQIINGVETMVNNVIRGFNTIISATRTLGSLTGRNIGFNVGYIGGISLPRLAQGAVIPPNREFLAVLGDQSSGTNIEAPLDTIKQAVAEVMASMGGANMPEKIQIVMPNGKVLAETVWDEEKKLYKQTGSYSPRFA